MGDSQRQSEGSVDALLIPAEGVLTTQLDGEIVILNSTTEEYLSINASGSAMWAAAISTGTVETIIASLSESFPNVAVERLRADFDQFVNEVVDIGLATRR